MHKRFELKSNMKCPIIIRWRTKDADFMQIEISPVRILRIKVDRLPQT
ncbi:MAG: hypothetical protein WC300_00800 [Candidatus Omnitrophota bacterium]|jgi:hypothetical protein